MSSSKSQMTVNVVGLRDFQRKLNYGSKFMPTLKNLPVKTLLERQCPRMPEDEREVKDLKRILTST